MKAPLKIVLFARSLLVGGTERQLICLAKGLKDAGHEVTVALFYAGGPLDKVLESAGIPLRALGKTSRYSVLTVLRGMVRLVRSEKPDVLNSFLGTQNIAAALIKPFCGRTKVVWGIRAAYVDLSRFGFFSRVIFWLAVLLSRIPDLIIANSEAGRKYHVGKGYPGALMKVIPNGIDTEAFKPDPDGRSSIRRAWKVPDNGFLVGLSGRLDPMKDHENFIRAAALMTEQRSDVYFVCVGGGTPAFLAKLVGLGRALGIEDRLIWAGERTDMQAIYSAFDLACSCSLGEGFSNSIAEAMACGAPCVVTNAGDSALIVGNTGVVVPTGDPRAIAEALQSMLKQDSADRQKSRQEARARIVKEFSLGTMVQQYERVYAEVASRVRN